jgi:large subunit ribosomal protein L1
MKKSKNYKKAIEAFEKDKAYSIEEALDILDKFPKAKFDETIEVHVKTEIDPKKTDQQVRATVSLPHGNGKEVKVIAFTENNQEEVKKAGADLVGGEELIAEIASKKVIDADVAVASPDMMPKLAKIAKILGPRGLMPNAKSQTVSPQVDKMVKEIKKGKATFKSDKGANIHLAIGKRSFDKKALQENFEEFKKVLQANKPEAVKKSFIKNISISATMTPGIKIKS